MVDAGELENDPKVKARMDSELAALAEKEESDIDLSDAPELPGAEWKNAIHGVDAWLKTARARS